MGGRVFKNYINLISIKDMYIISAQFNLSANDEMVYIYAWWSLTSRWYITPHVQYRISLYTCSVILYLLYPASWSGECIYEALKSAVIYLEGNMHHMYKMKCNFILDLLNSLLPGPSHFQHTIARAFTFLTHYWLGLHIFNSLLTGPSHFQLIG